MSSSFLITAQALQAHLAQNPATVLVCDCRFDLVDPDLGQRAYDVSHLPGAVYVDLGRSLSGEKNGRNGRHPLPEADVFAKFLATLGVNHDTLIVGVDAHGGLYGSRLWWLARWVGHANVVVLDGGMAAWEKAGYTLTTAQPAARPLGNFKRSESLVVSVELANMQAGLGRADRLIVDARAGDRFQGQNETLDPIAGHIPGAASRPVKDNLNDDGTFKAPEVLRAELSKLLGSHPAKDLVASCGSGVSACHLLLALELAGMSGGALYGGSWSEWSSQPNAPIETGPSTVTR
jgi:thiosulfate/3-mercaptopyruvate sulfurtransferase